MLSQRYKPTDISGIIGNKKNIDAIQQWIQNIENSVKNTKKCLLISGNSGIGKTLSIELILKAMKYNIVDLNSDDERDKEYIKGKIKPMLQVVKTVFGKKNALVVNDLDCLSDHGFISALIDCIKETKIPIICTCNDRYNQAFKTFATYCEDIKFRNPSTNEIYNFINPIYKKEKILISENNAKILIENSNNDVRNTLNNLQLYNHKSEMKFDKDSTQIGIFDMANIMLSQTSNFERKYKTFWLDSDLSPLMVHENYIANTMKSKIETEENKLQNLDNLFAAASCLSNIDLFESDIEATNWELMPYIAVNCISASANCHTRAQIKFPTFLAKTSTKGKNKRIIQELSVKFGQYRISNSTFKLEYLNYILITLFESLFNDKTKGKITKFVVKCLDFGFTKEDIQENIFNLIISCEDYNKYNYKSIETKTKNAIVKGFATIE
jgi:replication factor C subunit 1